MSGSTKDNHFVEAIQTSLKPYVYSKSYVASAHRDTKKLLETLDENNEQAKKYHRKVIWITVAGKSNALSGVVSGNTPYPVIAIPPFQDHLDMMINIQSTLQCPTGIPVLLVLDIHNLALAVKRILDL